MTVASLKRLCSTLGWQRCRRWKEFVSKVKGLEAKAGAAASPPEAPDRYDLDVAWDESTASIGVSRSGSRRMWVHGRVKGQRSERVYVAPKLGGVYHLVFLPHDAREGLAVRVNGVDIGPSFVSYAPGSEWGLAEDLVAQARAEIPHDSPWVEALAADLGLSLKRSD